jgi:hypothetical protein
MPTCSNAYTGATTLTIGQSSSLGSLKLLRDCSTKSPPCSALAYKCKAWAYRPTPNMPTRQMRATSTWG